MLLLSHQPRSNKQASLSRNYLFIVNLNLLNTGDFRLLDLAFETKEQSIEMQLPFIAKVMENRPYMFKVIPVYVGTVSHEHQPIVAQRFLPYLKDPSSAFIFSTSLCHWGKIFGFDSKVGGLTALDSIKSLDEKAITALRELRCRPFEEFLYDNKVKVFDHRVISICLWLVQLFLTDDKFSIIQMDEEKQLKAFVRTAKFDLMGQAWSFPGVREEDNCVSFISAAIPFDCRKYIPEEDPEPDPLSKQC
ncbi:hypothetical protein FBUS_10217 [Fasciolopsis buskii]|uniref:Protein MEMO1 n=1 Tax=Fasciolopsis buskii TaxID=27845 RepID=A0A8E0RSR7_9TREM|nr:hypothetical protein FBUS_10217 [Fasciolopsis buski]